MGRWTDRESDAERLPEGLERVGYDADTQTYTFRDETTGAYYEGEEGNRYGVLRPTGHAPDSMSTPPSTFPSDSAPTTRRYLLPLLLALALGILYLVLRFLDGSGPVYGMGGGGYRASKYYMPECGGGVGSVRVRKGDTCYEMAARRGVELEDFLAAKGNEGVECGELAVGSWVCMP